MRTERGGRSRLGAAGIAKILVASAAGVFLAWMVVRTSMVDAFVRGNPFQAALFWPDHPQARMGIAMAELELRNGDVSPEARAAALAAYRRYPLAEEPFLIAGLDALARGDARRGERLLHEAEGRNPRSRTARLLLLDQYLRSNRVTEAGVEITVLSRLIPRAREVLIPQLAQMLSNGRTRPAMMRVLQGDPQTRLAVLQHLAASGADPDLALQLYNADAPGARPEDQSWQGIMLSKLVEKGDIGRAYQLWRTFSGAGEETGGKGLYDGGFEGRPGPAPFNWRLGSGGAGVAERARGSLQVEYYGRAKVELAAQLLMLAPGRYRLQFKAEGDATGEGSILAWTVSCVPGKERLLEVPLRGITYTARAVAGVLTVPAAGCAAQWLKLEGTPTEFPAEQNATIRDLQLVPAGAA